MSATVIARGRSARRPAVQAPYGFPLIVLFGGVLPLVVAVSPGVGDRDLLFWLQLAFAAYSGTRLAWTALADEPRLLQGAFWLFVYTAMGLAPLAQVVLGRTPTPTVGGEFTITLAVFYTWVGCLSYDVARYVGQRAPMRSGRSTSGEREFDRYRLGVLAMVALASSGALVLLMGGPDAFLSSRQELAQASAAAGLGGGDSNSVSALVFGMGQVPIVICMLVYTRWLRVSAVARSDAIVVATWVVLVLGNLIVNNPLSQARYWVLTIAFAMVFVTFPRNMAVYRAALLGGSLAALLLFPFADRFRYDDAGYRPLQTTSWLETLTVKDYDQTAMFANGIEFVANEGHTLGQQTMGALLFWVPRQLWPGKPVDTGVLIGEWMRSVNTNLSAPLWLEAWIDLGAIFVIVVFCLVGYFSARGDRAYARHTLLQPRAGAVMSVAVPLIAGYEFILLRGSLLQAMGRVAVAAACIWFLTTKREDRRLA